MDDKMKCNTVKDENTNNNLSVSLNTNIKNTLQNLTELYFDHKYEEICKILKIEHDSNYNKNDEPINKYNKNESGMIFYENENPIIQTRVYVDEETKNIYNTLIMITSNSTDEINITDLIIEKWLKDVHIIGLLNCANVPKIIGNEYRISIKVSKQWWVNLTKSCKNKNILVKTGFKMSLLNYLEEICNNIKCNKLMLK